MFKTYLTYCLFYFSNDKITTKLKSLEAKMYVFFVLSERVYIEKVIINFINSVSSFSRSNTITLNDTLATD